MSGESERAFKSKYCACRWHPKTLWDLCEKHKPEHAEVRARAARDHSLNFASQEVQEKFNG